MNTKFSLWGVVCSLVLMPVMGTAAIERGLVESPTAKNLALIVGVSHGLPGIDLDMNNVDKMVTHPDYKFETTQLSDSQATFKKVSAELQDLSSKVDANGTLLFYFSGHGGNQIISLQDKLIKIQQIRQAIEAGRSGLTPLSRLVLIFDSCYSGSLLDPVKASGSFADQVVAAMQPTNRDSTYWKKLFVFASSRADETSNAGDDGSEFTVAMAKAFDESMQDDLTIGGFISLSQKYTVDHHPVARLVPEDLSNEKMRN